MNVCDMKLRDLVISNSSKKVIDKEINNETNLILDLDYDSMQIINLIVDIENTYKFEFEIENLDLNVITNFGSLKNMIIKKMTNT